MGLGQLLMVTSSKICEPFSLTGGQLRPRRSVHSSLRPGLDDGLSEQLGGQEGVQHHDGGPHHDGKDPGYL